MNDTDKAILGLVAIMLGSLAGIVITMAFISQALTLTG